MAEDDIIMRLDADGSGTDAVLESIDAGVQSLAESIAALAESAGDFSALDDAMAELSAMTAQGAEEAAALSESMAEVALAATDTSAQIDGLNATIDQLSGSIAEDTAIISALNEQIVNLEAQIAALTMEETGAEESTGGLLAAFAALGEMATGLGEQLQAAMGPLMMIGTIAGLVGGKLIGMGMDGQKGEALLSGAAGVSQADIEALQADALKLGESMDQASSGFYEVESAGYSGADALKVFDAASRESLGMQFDQKDAMSSLTAEMHDYNASVDQATYYADLSSKAIKQGKQDASDFTSSIGPLAAQAASVGISFDQVAAAEATMTQINPHVRQDTQQLTSLFRFLSPTMGGVIDKAKSLGLSFDEQSYSSMNLLQKLQYLSDLAGGTNTRAFVELTGGVRGSTAAMDLLQNNASAFTQNLDAMQHSTGTTQQAFEDFENTVPAHLDKVGASLSIFATRIMDAIGPKVIPIIDGFSATIGKVGDFLLAHGDVLNAVLAGLAGVIGGALVAAIVALVAASWPILTILLGLGVVVGGAVYVFEHWGQIMGWLSGLLGGIGNALSGVANAVSTHFHTILDTVTGFFAAARNNATTGMQNIHGAVQHAGDSLHSWWDSLWNSIASSPLGSAIIKTLHDQFASIGSEIAQSISQLGPSLSSALSGMQPALKNLGDSFGFLWQQIMLVAGIVGGILSSSWKAIEPIFAAVGRTIETTLSNSLKVIIPLFIQLGQIIGGVLVQSWQAMQPVLAQIGQAFAAVGHAIGGQLLMTLEVLGAIIGGVILLNIAAFLGAIVGLAKGLATFIQGIVLIITGLVQIFSGAMQIVSGVIAFFVDLATGHFDKLGADLGTIWNGIITMFTGVWNVISGLFEASIGTIISFIEGFVSTIVQFFTSLYHSLVGGSIVPDMINGIVSWFEQLPDRVGQAIISMIDTAMSLLHGLEASALNVGASIINNIATGITNAIGNVGNAIGQVSQYISDHLPHSPAKEGALKDLELQGSLITKQISQGMLSSLPDLQSTLRQLTNPIALNLTPTLPSSVLLSVPAAGGGNDQAIAFLANIASSLQQLVQQSKSSSTGSQPSVAFNAVSGSTITPQQFYQFIQSLSGYGYESVSRGGY